jgi:ubiquinone/menaquinone biosynthesis C-methylase UbiE
MAAAAKFWDKVAQRYSKKPIGDEAAYLKKLEITRGHLRPDMEMLEFGCGTGSTAIEHAPYVKHILATDISSNMIEIARDKARAAKVENVTFAQSTIEELKVPRESVDIVLGLSILHLLKDKQQAIEKVYALLKPNGLFVSNTMCLADTMPFFKYIAPIGRFFGVMPYVNIFTQSELEDCLASAGFVIDHQSQPGKDKAVFVVARKAV